MARGFYSTLGVSTTDRIVTGSLIPGGWTTWSIWFDQNGLGGNSLGRLFNEINGVYQLFIDGGTTPGQFRLDWAFSTQARQTTLQLGSNSLKRAHLMIAWDVTSVSNLPVGFLNGKPLATASVVQAGSGSANTPDKVVIGNNNSGTRGWDGVIGDFAIWRGALLRRAHAEALFRGVSPLDIAPGYLAEYLLMDGNPRSALPNNQQPVITGTKQRTGGNRFPSPQFRPSGLWVPDQSIRRAPRYSIWC